MNADRPWDGEWGTGWRSPQTPAEREDQAAWSLVEESRFRPSVVYRARQRLRHQAPTTDPKRAGAWRLPGLDRFGDTYDDYWVTLAGKTYACTCWGHMGGEFRRRRICSHILAVMLWRRTNHDVAAEPEAPVEAQPDEDEETAAPVPDAEDATPTPDLAPVPGGWYKPADLGLPWGEFRGVQLLAIKRAVAAFEAGAKVVCIDAPTGSGKTGIGAAIAKILHMPAVYAAPTKQLQDQFITALPGLARTLKGRSNYTPLNYLPPEEGCPHPDAHDQEGRRVTCEECDLESVDDGAGGKVAKCSFCHRPALCSYLNARKAAFVAPFAVLNTAYFMHEANYGGRFSDLGKDGIEPKHPHGLRLFIFDEGDELEKALMSFVEVEISKAVLHQCELQPPDVFVPTDKLASWGSWIQDVALPKLAQTIDRELEPVAALKDLIEDADRHGLDGRAQVEYEGRTIDLRVARYLYAQARRKVKSLDQAADKLKFLFTELTENPQSWVRTDVKPEKGTAAATAITQDLCFRPAHIGRYAEKHLWRHGSRFLVMSATVLSGARFADDLGLTPSEVAYLSLPMTFPRENRLIHYAPVGSMSFKDQAQTMPLLIADLNRTVAEHQNERVLVHTVSFRLASLLCAGLEAKRRLVTFGNLGRDMGPGHYSRREEALDAYRAQPGAVLIGPGLERGIDLKGDLCRVQYIAKLPFPNTQDRQVAQRLYAYGRSGQEWYTCQTIRNLVQATGRGMREPDDWCYTRIVDAALERLLREGRHWFPGWWLDALVMEPAPALA